MQLIDGKPVFSATDLVGYLACEHLTALERAAMEKLVNRPNRPDPELDVIRRRGFQHEARYLSELRAAGRAVVEIVRDDTAERGDQIRRQAEDTAAAMRHGADVIFQATFFDGRWLGYADFLLRVDGPSNLGPYHYEVADTKLARHVKAGAVLQICSYVEQLKAIQGVPPEEMHVVLGGSARETATLRVDDYMAYYRAAKRRFEAAVLGTDGVARAAAQPTHRPRPTRSRWSTAASVAGRSCASAAAPRRTTTSRSWRVSAPASARRSSRRDLHTVGRLAAAPIASTRRSTGRAQSGVERRPRAGPDPGRGSRVAEGRSTSCCCRAR